MFLHSSVTASAASQLPNCCCHPLFLPHKSQVIFLNSLFGYLCILIVYKWATGSLADLYHVMIYMFLQVCACMLACMCMWACMRACMLVEKGRQEALHLRPVQACVCPW